MPASRPRETGSDGAPSSESFDAWARASPGRIAIRHAGLEATTYGELEALACRIASGIATSTSGPGARAGILCEDAATLAASLLGTLKANAVFVPLDPANPRARLTSIVADTRPTLVLADERSARLGESLAGAQIPLLRFAALPASAAAVDLPPPAPPDALAWILYTSSSTGPPKGVMQTRRNVFAYAGQVIDGLALGPADRMLLASPLSVHAGATLSLAALSCGASLTPVDLRRTGIERMAAIIEEQATTVIFAVPTIFRALVRLVPPGARALPRDLSSVRLLRLSGETVTRADVDDAWRVFPGLATVSVGLGATETGGICHAYFRRGDAVAGRIPVGTPVAGVDISLVDGRGRSVPDGNAGEIVVTSATLSPGYWEAPAATAAVFENVPGGRRYRTGDLGRRLPDGTLEHLGRKGFQIKINGQRVEIAEIEAALRRLPGVADAAVRFVRREDGRGLAAYVVAQPGIRLLDSELRGGLAERLPRYMIPASYTHLAVLPTTRSGKVRVGALRGGRAGAQLPKGGPAASSVEAALCEIWREVLAVARAVGRDDDFLALGGDSLGAAQVRARIEAAFGRPISLAEVFDAPTPARLAAVIRRKLDEGASRGARKRDRDLPGDRRR